MSREELLALAERAEQATGPDRELDAAIAAALGWRKVPNPTSAGGLIDAWYDPDGKQQRWTIPAYTASLDAAMSLVPEGWLLQGLMERNAVGEQNWRWKADLWTPKWDKGVRGIARNAHRNPCAPALALTAASLRSRAAMGEGL